MSKWMILTNSSNNVIEPFVLDSGFDLSGAQRAIETEEVSDETCNMRCGHRSSGKDLSRSVVESRDDIETRSPDVNASAKVREGSFGVVNGGGGDGDGLLDTSGRNVNNVLVLVPGGNDNRDAGAKKLEEEQKIRTDERFNLSRNLLGLRRCRRRSRHHLQDSERRRRGFQCVGIRRRRS